MDFEHIRLEQSPAAVATITLNRPDSLNALNAAMVDELRAGGREPARSPARAACCSPARAAAFRAAPTSPRGGGLPDDVGAALEKHFNPLIEALFACRSRSSPR